MSRPDKKWHICQLDVPLQADLADGLGISPVVAQVLINRGFGDPEVATSFLAAASFQELGDPWIMAGMAAAVERIGLALANKQQLTIYGDYDVDGMTATALLYRTLNQLGALVDYYIPERQSEGYGLNKAALEAIYATGSQLVITVDCGISGGLEVAAMADQLDFIITDHHQPPQELPAALAIINPKQPGCPYTDKQLSGVGVVFKLCQALMEKYSESADWLYQQLDLVAIGTIADLVPLTGENRQLVKLGLAQLNNTANLGIEKLLEVCRITQGEVDAGKVGFMMAPRLNAAGRLDHGAAGVELLVTSSLPTAEKLANQLEAANVRRQVVEKDLLVLAEAQLAEMAVAGEKVLVLAGEDWHPGVLGIVAARLVDKFYRPVVMISLQEGIGKASCRSIPGFDIYEALTNCADLLLHYGGHKQAAGLSMEQGNISSLRTRLNELAAAQLTDEDFLPAITIDYLVTLDEVTESLVEQLTCLEPFGMGNPTPLLASTGLTVTEVGPLGQDGRHVKLQVEQNGCACKVLAWNRGDLTQKITGKALVDIAFTPEVNKWRSRRSIQLIARDVKIEKDPEGIILVDGRATADKIDYIVNLVTGAKQVLVLADDGRQALNLVGQLRSALGARAIGYIHPGQSTRRQHQVTTCWEAGNMAVLVAVDWAKSPAFGGQVVLFQPPLDWQIVLTSWQLAAKQEQLLHLHFLFTGREVEQRAAGCSARWPDREAVGRVYLTLKTMVQPTGWVECSSRQLLKACERRYGQQMTPKGVETAIAILGEIGLVGQTQTGARYKLFLQPEPKEKLDLEQSALFRQCTAWRQEFLQTVGDFQEAAVTTLWRNAVVKKQSSG